MNTRRAIQVGVGVMALLAFGTCWVNREPHYGGHSLTYWLAELSSARSDAAYERAAEAVSSIGVDGLPIVLRELRSKDSSNWDVIYKVGYWVEAKTGFTLSLLEPEPAYPRRQNALRAFAVLRTNAISIIPDLIKNLSDPELIEDSALALGLIGEPAFPEILLLTSSTNSTNRAASAIALTQFPGDQRATEALKQLMEDSDSDVRLVALWKYEETEPDPLAKVSSFMGRVEDANPQIQRVACDLLGRLGTNAVAAVPVLSNAMTQAVISADAARALVQIGLASRPVFQSLKTHGDGAVRAEALKGLIRQSSSAPMGKGELLGFLHDPNWQVRNLAIMGLRRTATNQVELVVPVVEALGREQNDSVRGHLLMVLIQVGEPATNALPLLTSLHSESFGDSQIQYLLTIAAISPSLGRALGASEELMSIAQARQTTIRQGYRMAVGKPQVLPTVPPPPPP